MRAKDIMSTDIRCVPADAPVADVARELLGRSASALPVVDASGAVVGIVSRRDVLQSLLSDRTGQRERRSDRQLREDIIAAIEQRTGKRGGIADFTVEDGVVHFWGSPPSDVELDIAREVMNCTCR